MVLIKQFFKDFQLIQKFKIAVRLFCLTRNLILLIQSDFYCELKIN